MIEELNESGFCILRETFSPVQCSEFVAQLQNMFHSEQQNAIGAGQGRVVGGRNLLDHWNGWRAIWESPVVSDFIAKILGPEAGLVRILYFDKPPGESWALSMHKDRTIAVKQHLDPPDPFSRPTTKAGVPHVVANDQTLDRMLTLRLHLDSMHGDNGPLVVIPGSHAGNSNAELQTIHCQAGDVFVMRPLLSHSSKAANPNTTDHRRVIHLEFSADAELAGGYQWHGRKTIHA